ncbi:MAG TPA: hypothetical protein VHM67_10885 [Gemmatimonadaceae bacterium]|nr:hypothetical protein [Gemmatimonadaceae bacterium]
MIRTSAARLSIVAAVVSLAGCAYYNGIYNARRADRAGERALADLDDTTAAGRFADAAAAAETVLARYPDSRWRSEALYLAGRGLAFTGECGRALSRLDDARRTTLDPRRRDRAQLASAWCLTLQSRHTEALALAGPLERSSDDEVARLALRISARARLGLGDGTGAARTLSRVDPAGGTWLLARDAVGRGLPLRAESLLAAPLRAGDARPELVDLVRDLWRRDTSVAWRITRTALASRAPGEVKTSLRLAAGELLAADGRDADARAVVAPLARGSTRDSASVDRARDMIRRGTLRDATSLDEMESRLRAIDPRGGTESVDLVVLLARTLAASDTGDGAGRFLAAEVVRDSLGALGVARALFTSLPAAAPLAPKGWLAAAALAGDSAPDYVAIARRRWPRSPYVRALDGSEGSDGTAFLGDSALRVTWERAVTTFSDSVAARRAAILIASPPRP